MTLLVPTADEPLLAKPGKHEDIGLADVVLASIKALKRKCRHSSVPKDGTDGNDAGAEGNSSSLSSHCCPRLLRLLFISCANMTISICSDFPQCLINDRRGQMKDERIETVMISCVRGWREYIKLCLDFRS